MEDKTKDTPETPEAEAEETVEAQEEALEEQATEENENSEYKELYDKYLRLLAEFENYKRRTQKEKEEIYALAKSDVVTNMLPVIDNFDRAEKVIEDPTVAEGIKLIHTQFDEFLANIGVEEIPAEGLECDPNMHSAVFHEDVEGEPENTVSEVFQKGYKIGERVIRHAMVKVVN